MDRALRLNDKDVLLLADKEQNELLTSDTRMCCLYIMCKGACFLSNISTFCEVEFMILSNRKAELSLGLMRYFPLNYVSISIGGRSVCSSRVLPDCNLIRRLQITFGWLLQPLAKLKTYG